jgi:ADP-ribosyl-[dinitrogen reductase] hydrolase
MLPLQTMAKYSTDHALNIVLNGIVEGDDIGGPTQISSLLSDSLSEQGNFDPNDIAAKYLNWWRNGAFDTGPTFGVVFSHVLEGMTQQDAVAAADKILLGQTAGCNPAHRIAPMAAFPFIKTIELPIIVRIEAQLTHHHPLAGETAAVCALLCRYMIEGNTWERSKELTSNMEPGGWRTIYNAALSKDGFAPDVMHTAIHFLEQADPLKMSKAYAGPSNYAPVIVGALSAVRNHFCPKG